MIKNKQQRNQIINNILQHVINNLNLAFDVPIFMKNDQKINRELPIALIYEINNETIRTSKLHMHAELRIHIISNFENQLPIQFVQHLQNYFLLSYQKHMNFDNLKLHNNSDQIENYNNLYYGHTIDVRILYQYPVLHNVAYNHDIQARLIISNKEE